MQVIYDQRQSSHAPDHFMAQGQRKQSPETPLRAQALLQGVQRLEYKIEPAFDFGMKTILEIHDSQYLAFLETAYHRWHENPNASEEVIPNIHPHSRDIPYPETIVGQAGYHQSDTACPIAAGTWSGAYWSAQTALTAADLMIKGQKQAYALCRPPGHHAFSDQAGGFCFLNNSALAAQSLLTSGFRPAILDVDVHHGNGTQEIFYNRNDVLTLSIHADPKSYYPFFWGHENETGQGLGEGFNYNITLPRGTENSVYLVALDRALKKVSDFKADILVVALGLDAHENDPLEGFKITTEGFSLIAAQIAQLGLPCLFVQEGGYMSPDLSRNLESFLTGYQK